MKQYIDLCKKVLEEGIETTDRTGTGTKSLFGYQMRFDMKDGFPLLTTKKMFFPAVVHELLWFIAGDTNIKYLVDNNVRIWNEWPYENYKKSNEFSGETLEEFVNKIKNDANWAAQYGNLGPVYGKQWRDFNGFDQLAWVIEEIKNNPDSRRLIVNSWNPPQLKDMALPPCHMMYQFYVINGKLSLQLYQRSADIFLGVPFNIASYSLMLLLVAKATGLEPGEFVHTIGDAHIYLNHMTQVNKQIKRDPKELPQLIIKEVKDLFDYTFEDIELVNYKHHPGIKGVVSV